MSELLRLEGICKVYDKGLDEAVILDDINLYISEKEFVCLLGPFGCGKSTLMKILGGIEKPTLGTIYFKGKELNDGIPRQLLPSFGSVFQNNVLLNWRSVRKNLELSLEIFGLKGQQWEERIDDLLEMVGLSEYQDIFPHELSGGMRQRAGIARALVHDPEILILDQPFGALDAIIRKMISYEVRDIWKKTQKTIFMVTNNMNEALLLSTRILIMDKEGNIAHEFINDVPQEARNESIALDPNFSVLRAKLSAIIHKEEDEED